MTDIKKPPEAVSSGGGRRSHGRGKLPPTAAGGPVFTGGTAVPTAGEICRLRRRRVPVFTGGNKRGQDTRYGFLSPLDSPYLPLR